MACSPVQCQNRAAGWNSNICEYFTGGADQGRCKNDGTCYGVTEIGGCLSRTKSSTPSTTCVDASCRDDMKCIYPQDTSSYTPAIACIESGACGMGAMGTNMHCRVIVRCIRSCVRVMVSKTLVCVFVL